MHALTIAASFEARVPWPNAKGGIAPRGRNAAAVGRKGALPPLGRRRAGN